MTKYKIKSTINNDGVIGYKIYERVFFVFWKCINPNKYIKEMNIWFTATYSKEQALSIVKELEDKI